MWCPLSEALAEIAKNSPVKECCAGDLIWLGIQNARLKVRGRPIQVAPEETELLLLGQKRPSAAKDRVPSKSYWSSLQLHEDADWWFDRDYLLVTSADGAITVWINCALRKSDLEAFLASRIYWRDESEFGRPRKEIEWQDFLQAVLRLERYHVLNAASCKGTKELKGWIMQLMRHPLAERSLDRHIEMLWKRFVANHHDQNAARWGDVERALEDEEEALARNASPPRQ